MTAVAEALREAAQGQPGVLQQHGGEPDRRSPAPAHSLQAPGEFLTFKLGAEEYGIDILTVQEIRSYEPPTRIAHAPSFVKGIVNLRGVIVPLVDLRLRFSLDQPTYNDSTVVIVLNLSRRIVGVVVDSVSDVLLLSLKHIKPAPQFSGAVDGAFITGIGSIQERMTILLDIEALLSRTEMGAMNTHVHSDHPTTCQPDE
jgi:purine-binding chemotaxis protein CheW